METRNVQMTVESKGLNIPCVIASFSSGYSYFAQHIPTGENWYIVGIDVKGNRVCAGGWPPSIGKLSDCKNFEKNLPLDESELKYRERKFGLNWL